MKFQVGDRVKFLNESGGGIISRIITPSLVHVMIEDGFEIPTASGDLIPVSDADAAGRFFQEDMKISKMDLPEGTLEGNASLPERVSPLHRIAGIKPFPDGVYLAFAPQNQRWLITGALDIFLVNNTDYDIMYSYMLIEDDKSYACMDTDTMSVYSMTYLQTIDREEVGDWNQGIVQVIFHKESMKKVLLPASFSFHVKEATFTREDQYVVSSLMPSKALFTTLVDLRKLGTVGSRASDGSKQEEGKATARAYREPSVIDKHTLLPGIAEVDLHIEELVDSEQGLDAEHILRIQLDYGIRCLEDAMQKHYQKVILIHGVGSGTLKSALKNMLEEKKGVEYRQASMAKYGVGAIEVLIKHNRK